jgi:hypothetical protein
VIPLEDFNDVLNRSQRIASREFNEGTAVNEPVEAHIWKW